MEFRDLKMQYAQHKKEIDQAIQKVLNGTDFIMGSAVKSLEQKLAEYVGVKHCITCANGTDALQLALMVWNIGMGDAVFVPDFTFFSTAEVVSLCGATPIFVDIDPETFNIDAASLENAIVKVQEEGRLNIRAIIAVDLFGQPADFSEIRKIAEKYQLYLLEDGAQGFGGKIGDDMACSFGDIATTSFFPAKPLGCYGDGGALFTDNDTYADVLRSLRVHGKGADKYDNIRIGMNSRLDTLQAAVLGQKLQFFEDEIERCQVVARHYDTALNDVVKTPVVLQKMRSGWAQYTICLKSNEERNFLQRELAAEGIPTAVYYKCPLHLQKAFEMQLYKVVSCENTERISKTCLSLPMHAYLGAEDMDRICNAVRGALGRYNGE